MGSLDRHEPGVGRAVLPEHIRPGQRGVGERGWVQRERASQNRLAKFVPEGIEGAVPYRVRLNPWCSARGGLRSGMGYLGCGTILEVQEKARFVRISGAGLRESHVHDVIITERRLTIMSSNDAASSFG